MSISDFNARLQADFYESNLIERRTSGETIAETAEQKSELFRRFFQTELGNTFYQDYGLDTVNPQTGQTNAKTIEQIFLKLYAHDPRMTLSRVADAVQTAIQAGALVKPPEPVFVSPPRTEDGKFANSHQLLRAEVRRMLADPQIPSSALRARADKDAAFGAAFRAELSGESSKPSVSTEIPGEELRAFMQAFYHEPVRFIAGYVALGGQKYSKSEYDHNLSEAARLGL